MPSTNVLLFLAMAFLCLLSVNGEDQDKNVLVGSNFTLQCTGDGKLTWSFEPELLIDNTKSFDEQGSRWALLNFGQTLVIFIKSVTYQDTGNYVCWEDGVKKSSTYLFANDQDECGQLLVPLHESESTQFMVYLGESFWIPCRATTENATIILDYVPSGNQFDYNPKRGFYVPDPTLYESGIWDCRAVMPPHCPQRDAAHTFLVHVTGDDKESRPRIVELDNTDKVEGSNVHLNCYFSTDNKLEELFWVHPNGSTIQTIDRFLVDKIAYKTGREAHPFDISTDLHIYNFSPEFDSGTYTCTLQSDENLTDRILL
ncbi:platelet-derived growth factor receptor-like protein [Cloeon dipterum]|uniref:platelet-derived growth factor receptor-like protein n=1 Tax=Cloeon dipterum TaxID=197152 RepID=UPI00321F87B8